LERYDSFTSWQAEAVTTINDGDVLIELSGSQTITLLDHGNRGEDFVNFAMDTVVL
jgi:hypothetical protein